MPSVFRRSDPRIDGGCLSGTIIVELLLLKTRPWCDWTMSYFLTCLDATVSTRDRETMLTFWRQWKPVDIYSLMPMLWVNFSRAAEGKQKENFFFNFLPILLKLFPEKGVPKRKKTSKFSHVKAQVLKMINVTRAEQGNTINPVIILMFWRLASTLGSTIY